jgi:hypothetical protein
LALAGCDHQISSVVELEAFPWGDDGGGAVFGDDGGAGVFLAGAEGVSGVDSCFEFLAVE